VVINIRSMLKRFQTMYRSDSDYLNKTVLLFFLLAGKVKGDH